MHLAYIYIDYLAWCKRRVESCLQHCTGVQVQGTEGHLLLTKLLLNNLTLCRREKYTGGMWAEG